MRIRSLIIAACIAVPSLALMLSSTPAVPMTPAGIVADAQTRTPTGVVYSFAQDVDAVSFQMPDRSLDARVRGWNGAEWTPWEQLEIEFEFDPLLKESNMVMFPRGVKKVELASAEPLPIHPIRVSREPVAYQTAAELMMRMPRILSRAEWGADENILVKGPETARSDANANGGEDKENAPAPSPTAKRVVDCKQMQRDYPGEFKTVKTVRTNEAGEKLRWAQQYSPDIKLIVVHHTALQVAGDERPPVERVRALYSYHANGRGWGDVGYNFIIDEKGQIYEGRAGGSHVVAGHAYCHNIGTLGISLLGNFELEKPTQDQVSALQWLLRSLALTENIDLTKPVTFHGVTTPPIVGHGDVVSTTCPGFYLREVLPQVRQHVAEGKMYAHVTFPSLTRKYSDKTDQRKAKRTATRPQAPKSVEGVTPRNDTHLVGRPGTQQIISIRYQSGEKARAKGTTVAQVKIPAGAGVWQDIGNGFERVRNSLELGEPVPSKGQTLLRVKVQFPEANGRVNLQIGGITYVLETAGRLGRAADMSPVEPVTPVRERPKLTPKSNSASSASSRPKITGRAALGDDGPNIRIRLSYGDAVGAITTPPSATVNGKAVMTGNLRFNRDGDTCVVSDDGDILGAGVVRIDGRGGIIELTSWSKRANRFRGVIECRIVDGTLTFINELPLEQYLRGLSEEPDTEPYEKQRAFAIAARSYAAYYMDPSNPRKFPGKPYDGADDPAIFQVYAGVDFEEHNPNWLKAMESTRLMVLKVDGKPIKVPYFSASNGRTLSPAQAGWTTFPHPEIFSSKADPWCEGLTQRGHGVGMSGCGAKAQALEGKTGEQILEYYYPGAKRERL